MTQITVYSTGWCPYCTRAKRLLDSLGASYTEIMVDEDADKMAEMIEKSDGRKSVPQIFIHETHIGGCDELHDLHRKGRLEPMLEA